MTPDHGLQAAYVRGARGRRLRPVLMAGNLVEAALSARTEAQLAQATVELVHSRGPLLPEPLAGGRDRWVTALTATALPEGQPYPRLYQALDGLLAAIEAAPSASGWGAALVRYELLLLAELGFGLDLERCAVSGANDDWSPSARDRAGRSAPPRPSPIRASCCRFRAFVVEGGRRSWPDILDGLALTGHFLLRD